MPRNHSSDAREVRTVDFDALEVRTDASDSEIRVVGHAAVTDKPAWIGPKTVGFSERFASGAWTKTIKDGADVRFLFNHNPDHVLARTANGTLTLGEDSTGLPVNAVLAPTSVGRDLAILMERGDVNQMSVGMEVVRDKWESVRGGDGNTYELRTILEAKLYDVSAVTFPAYEETDVGVRACEKARELRDARGTTVLPVPEPVVEEPSTDTPPVEKSEVRATEPVSAPPTSTPTPVQTPSLKQGVPIVSKALYDERARIWNQMQSLLKDTEDRTMSAEEENSWANMEADMERVSRSIDIREKGEAYSSFLDSGTPGEPAVSTRSTDNGHPAARPDPHSSAAARALETPGDIQRSYNLEKAFDDYVRRGESRMSQEHLDLLTRETRALSIGTNSAGGFTVPPGFLQRLTDALKMFGGMLQTCNVINTTEGNSLVWPTADDTGNVGAILSENSTASNQDITFGQRTLGAYMYTSKLIQVSLQLLQDSAFNLDAWLPMKFAQRIGRAINAHFTNGTGGGTQPVGLVPNATVGKTGLTGQTLTVIYDDLVDLIHSIDPAYRASNNPLFDEGGGARWMMSDSAVKVVRKLKDTQGHPLWEPSVQVGVPDVLLGYPITINQDMPVMAPNAKSIAFGNFREAYVIRQVQGAQVLRLNERYADALQVGFLSFARYDGTYDDLRAVALYQNSAT